MAVDKVNKKAAVIDVAVPDSNIRKKEHQKLEGYQGPKEQLERERGVKSSGHMGLWLGERSQQNPGPTSEISVQKSVARGTAEMLRTSLLLCWR